MRWFDQIAFQAKLNRGEVAVIFPGGMATYGRLVECIENATQHVLRAGLQKGETVALELQHPLLHLVVILALHRCGIPSITLQTSHLIAESKLKVDHLLSDRLAPSGSVFKLILVTADWLSPPSDVVPLLPVPGFDKPTDICRLVLSSGTTGKPKVIGISEDILQQRFMRTATMNQRARVLSMMGFSTLGGYQMLMTTLALGGAVCFAGPPEDVLQVISLFHVERLIAAPFQIRTLLELQAKTGVQCPRLNEIFLAGGVLTRDLLAAVQAHLCPNVICAYGSTELGMLAYGSSAAMRGIEGATGFVMPDVQIEVLDKDGQLVSPGEEGILRVRSEAMDRYFVATGDDARIFKDGYFYPGDVGRLMPGGLLVITGRTDELINRGGDKAAPDLIEDVIRKCPGVIDAAVFADPGTNQIWAAVVATAALREELVLESCRKNLAGMAPSRLIRVSRIPRNDMGKVVRDELRKAVMQQIPPSS